MKPLHMLAASPPRPGKHAGLDRSDDFGHLGIGKKRPRLALDVAGIPPIHDILRHRGLKFALAPKHDDREELVMINAQILGQCPGVPVILMQRVLKLGSSGFLVQRNRDKSL